jgi:hypothetical protein
MIVRCYNDPWMTDFIQVCARMPQDEREQLTALTGEEYNIDSAAVGNFMVPGPKWVIKAGSAEDHEKGLAQPIIIGGFVPQRPGVYRDFLLTTSEAWEQHGFQVTRICRRIMDAMLMSHAHRLECIVPAPRVESRPELAKWYKVLGYHQEGRHYGYCANGADALSFSRVKH